MVTKQKLWKVLMQKAHILSKCKEADGKVYWTVLKNIQKACKKLILNFNDAAIPHGGIFNSGFTKGYRYPFE